MYTDSVIQGSRVYSLATIAIIYDILHKCPRTIKMKIKN